MNLATLRKAVWASMDDWSDLMPHRGPCWPIARVLANSGLGHVEFCQVYCKTDHQWYGHFLVRTPEGKIVDASGEYVCQQCPPRNAPYKDFRVEDEPEHWAYPPYALKFWQRRLGKHL